MNNYLVKFDSNWADEFNTKGFELMSKEDCDLLFEGIKNCQYPVEIGFGTNEFWEFSSPEEVFKVIEVKILSEQEATTIYNIFFDKYTSEYGMTPFGQFEDYLHYE